ncbi:glycine--tRNA ligase [candidate division LCP-89 bacterium B3_LCP]|uniref:Glycine--tRNA ligase n=1 Tax=candidate division LCP-89 bacterium B3_LCP TaxID=2012998 RepID=A0A532V3D1_UNCL8|nr:MAG: glycine--tRNA ligase [candidate division LCP-89 bacterium B3_LCP]
MPNNKLMEKIVSLAKRRGFVFASSEIYGGLNSCWDYGPLGVELKKNIQDFWWNEMTLRNDIVGLDSSILMHPRIWEASGHVDSFTDPMVDCRQCKARFKADDLPQDKMEKRQCPNCGTKDALTDARNFNLMFKTFMGPLEDDTSTTYLRPETAQGIYVNYLNVATVSRLKIPFGIAQVGKAFRNEITPGNFIFRTREFSQMEMQYFVKPGDDEKVFEEWKERRMDFYLKLGIREEKLRFKEHGPDELAHYAKTAWDIQYEFPFGWQELEGVHNRTDFDLKRHQEHSGKSLLYFDDVSKEKFLPYIIETSAGLNRTMLTVMLDAYWEDEEHKRIVLKLHPKLAPIKAVICPLVKKDGLPEIARQIENDLRPHFPVIYDQQSSIGKRYYRQDEAGTPYGITVDHQSLEDNTVTLRERDTLEQVRLPIPTLLDEINSRLKADWKP